MAYVLRLLSILELNYIIRLNRASSRETLAIIIILPPPLKDACPQAEVTTYLTSLSLRILYYYLSKDLSSSALVIY